MLLTRTRVAARLVMAIAVTAALSLGFATPASAHGDRERADTLRSEYSAGMNIPLINSPNVNLVASNPGSAGISGCFTKTAPTFVMSSLDSVKVYDVSDPLKPTLTGTMPSAQFENEAMNCGERKTRNGTKRFALIGVDLYQTSPDDIEHTNIRPLDGYELIVVDVTDPTNPHIRSRAAGTTSTHTVSCIAETDCQYAYSAGSSTKKKFSIFDMTDLDKPVATPPWPAYSRSRPRPLRTSGTSTTPATERTPASTGRRSSTSATRVRPSL